MCFKRNNVKIEKLTSKSVTTVKKFEKMVIFRKESFIFKSRKYKDTTSREVMWFDFLKESPTKEACHLNLWTFGWGCKKLQDRTTVRKSVSRSFKGDKLYVRYFSWLERQVVFSMLVSFNFYSTHLSSSSFPYRGIQYFPETNFVQFLGSLVFFLPSLLSPLDSLGVPSGCFP